MSFWNAQSGGAYNSPGASENTARTMVAVANDRISVVNNGASDFGSDVGGDVHGQLSIGLVGVLIIGLVLFYAWTRNVQGGG